MCTRERDGEANPCEGGSTFVGAVMTLIGQSAAGLRPHTMFVRCIRNETQLSPTCTCNHNSRGLRLPRVNTTFRGKPKGAVFAPYLAEAPRRGRKNHDQCP